MAASDPTTDVPTPTGTLQGVAAFSWDGAAWQPTGRAGPSVATPTGVLRGVAAFNGSPFWQPSGRAQPGVTTPTGTLDGVAVYTWSGAAWTPPGGQPTPSTPSGALRGVAAFNWDGAAWQPAAQAGPSVATPYGVLDGVAMFGWSGSAWAAVGAPSLSLDFMQPGTLDPRITFTRASTATYFNSAGAMQTAATNAPRWDYNPSTRALNGLLLEEARTNVVLQSGDLSNAAWAPFSQGGPAAPTVTGNQTVAPDGTITAARVVYPAVAVGTSEVYQAITAVAAVYSWSIYLKGSVGGEQINVIATIGAVTYFVVRATLTTAWQRFTVVTGTLTPGSVIFAVGCDLRDAGQSGIAAQTIYVWGAQSEQGAFPTSYIPTVGAMVTRAADAASMPIAAWFNTTVGTYQAEFIPTTVLSAGGAVFVVSGNAGAPVIGVGGDSRLTTAIRTVVTIHAGVGPVAAFGSVDKAVFGYLSGASVGALNGTLLGANATTFATPLAVTLLALGGDGVSPGTLMLNGWLRRVQYWPRVLTNAEMQAVTT